ncbi:MAG: pyridoxamine 5'-phosphate oxidase [Anaerolineae bacterium]|nr:pyridoxamine 5'-phosphate oxidase [Anaerolineae bacterium]
MERDMTLHRAALNPNPMRQLEAWLADAKAAGILEPKAMTLATATPDGLPSARIVLLRGLDERGLVFYTHYDSPKGRDLTANPQAAVVFYWDALRRQVRVAGEVSRVEPAESEAYFATRPVGHRLSAWASPQSQPIPDRLFLEERLRDVTAQFGDDVPLPPYWGGFRLTPTLFEFWQNGDNRLHDRFRYTRGAAGEWVIERLAP